MLESIDILQKVKTKDDAIAFDRYLSQLEDRIKTEQVALLHEYLQVDQDIIYKNQMVRAESCMIRGKNSFKIFTKEQTIRVSKRTIDDFVILKQDMHKAPNYDRLTGLRGEIKEIKRKLDIEHDSKPKNFLDRILYYLTSPKDLGLERYLENVINFGGSSKVFASRYSKALKRDLRALAYGFGLAGLVAAFLLGQTGGDSGDGNIGNPMNSDTELVPDDMKDANGNTRWSPDGRSLPKPGKSNQDADGKEKNKEFKELQDKHLGKGEDHPPERMEDIRREYLSRTKDFKVTPIFERQDLSKSEGFFRPRDNTSLRLSNRSIQMQKPEVENPQRSLLLIYDVTGSMDGNLLSPEDIRATPSYVSPGYLAATQLIKSYSKMGVTMRIMRYPIGRATSASIFETNSMNAALEELLFKEGGADDDDAVERLGVLYITHANAKTIPEMDVVFITDAGPTYNGAANFIKLVRENRHKQDTIHWVNTNRMGRYELDVRSAFQRATNCFYHTAENEAETLAVAKKILENYKR